MIIPRISHAWLSYKSGILEKMEPKKFASGILLSSFHGRVLGSYNAQDDFMFAKITRILINPSCNILQVT